jgi:cysteine desulfurase
VYLDASSGEPLLPQARAAWLAAQDAGWGDPARLHRPGRLAAQALDRAREVVATAVGARPAEVVFTGSGVQSTYAAIAGLARGRRRVGTGIVTSAIEHSSTLAAAETYGRHLSVPVDDQGHLDLARWADEIGSGQIAAACLQVANHEVGTRQPYEEAADVCRRSAVPLVLDATSALGRLELSAPDVGWSVLTGAAGAFGGPVSVGFMVLRRGVRWRAPYPVDDYQDGRWPGRPDVPAIVASAVALETWLTDRERVAISQHALIDRLRTGIVEQVKDVDVVGDPLRRVPHLLTCSVLYVDGETLTLELDRAGIAVSSGSACSASSETPSHVLAAMGALTHGNLRIGVTRTTTQTEIDALLAALPPIVDRIRATLGAP